MKRREIKHATSLEMIAGSRPQTHQTVETLRDDGNGCNAPSVGSLGSLGY